MLNFRPKPVSFEVKHTFSVLRLTPVRYTNNIMLSHVNKTLLLRFQRLIFLNIVLNIALSYFFRFRILKDRCIKTCIKHCMQSYSYYILNYYGLIMANVEVPLKNSCFEKS